MMVEKTRKQLDGPEKDQNKDDKGVNMTPYTVEAMEKATESQYRAEVLNLLYQQSIMLVSLIDNKNQ
jgi:hypothetical protein